MAYPYQGGGGGGPPPSYPPATAAPAAAPYRSSYPPAAAPVSGMYPPAGGAQAPPYPSAGPSIVGAMPAGGAGFGAGAAPPRSSASSVPDALKQKVKLFNNSTERTNVKHLADLYAIIVATEKLDDAYNSNNCSDDGEYTELCNKLITQFKSLKGPLESSGQIPSVEKFMADFGLGRMHFAKQRLLVEGVPITVTGRSTDNSGAAAVAAETTQNFITAMDNLDLNIRSVDEVQPAVADVMQSLNKNTALPSDFEGLATLRRWLEVLNQMNASDELSDDQVRQLKHDLSTAYNKYHSHLRDMGRK